MEPERLPSTVLVVGAGPAGLMAADAASLAGAPVVVCDAMPSPARKLLMAGKSGLNVTKLGEKDFAASYSADVAGDFGPDDVTAWLDGLGQGWFAGSTGRVFPRAMKASPTLRAWLARLEARGVALRRRWRWTGWDGGALRFDTPEGPRAIFPGATVLALGGASWRRLGSDGAWAEVPGLGEHAAPFRPSNVGFRVDWSPHMAPHLGSPVKGIALLLDGARHRGEVVISVRGLEGGGLYPLTPRLREGAPLAMDLLPDLSVEAARARLAGRGKRSLSQHLRKALRLDAAKVALAHEWGRPLPDDLAPRLKRLPVPLRGPRPLDEAISTAGGLRLDALGGPGGLMLRDRPGTFTAGEMLDWEAPTGGWLITGALATGRRAGAAAAAWAG